MAKKKAHDIGAPDAEHNWEVNAHVFPGQGPGADYEHDVPYAVLVCACGTRKTTKLDSKESEEIRAFNLLPPEEIVAADDTEGGEEE